MRSVEFRAVPAETRPAIVCDDVKSLDIDGLRAAAVSSGQPVLKLIETRAAFLRGCCAPAGIKNFLEVQGRQTERVVLVASDLSTAEKPVLAGADVSRDAVALR